MMKHLTRWLVAGLLVAPIVAACDDNGQAPAPPETGELRGTVTVEGEPLAGITVAISGPESGSTTTGADGSYVFSEIEAGTYTVTISNIPADVTFEQTTLSVTVAGGQTASAPFNGDFIRTASIVGRVTADEANVVGITVRIEGPETASTQTDEEGRFSFTGLRAGDYTVILDAPDDLGVEFQSTSEDVSLAAGQTAEITFTGIVPRPAQAFIQSIQNMNGVRINPDAVMGRIFVVVEIVPGNETVSRVAITLNGDEVASQSVNVTPAASTTSDLAASSQNVTVELGVNTAAFDEETFEVDFPNGEYELGATLETSEGTTVAVSQSQTLTFDNADVLEVRHVDGTGNTAVSGGVRWWGGDDIQFEGRALIFSQQVQIDQLGVTCTSTGQTANGGADLDIGAGAGTQMMSESPFLFTAAADDNAGAVEDDPAANGHTCDVTSVLDPDGVDILPDLGGAGATTELTGFFVDFVAPQVDAPGPSEVTVDGNPVTAGDFLSKGDFGVSNSSELGVGIGSMEFDVLVDDMVEVDDPTDIENDVPERTDEYVGTLVALYDAVQNVADVDEVDDTPLFAVDKTMPETSDVLPAPGEEIIFQPMDPDGNPDNNLLVFTATDPDLADGNPGSGITPANVVAELSDGTAVTVDDAGAPDFVIDPNQANLGNGGMVDDAFDIEVTVPDNAIMPNENVFAFNVILDSTDPETNMLNPPSSSVTSSNATLSFTISGNASDANGLSSVAVTVRNPDSPSGMDGSCELADDLIPEGTGPGEVVDNTIDVTADADGFSTTVTINNNGAGTMQNVCFFIEAEDNARNNTGALEPNASDQSARTEITWN